MLHCAAAAKGVWDEKPYSGKEGYMEFAEDILMLVRDESDDVIDNAPWGYGGSQEREMKRVQYPYTVQQESTVVLACGTHHLVAGNRMYPLECLVRGPYRFPHQAVMEEWAINCAALEYSQDPDECWKRHCENPLAKHLRTQVIMRSVNRKNSIWSFNFQGKPTYLLCEVQTTFQDKAYSCPYI